MHRCRFSHDIPAYLAAKPKDIYFNTSDSVSDTYPYINIYPSSDPEAKVDTEVSDSHPTPESSVDFTTHCPNFEETGSCRHGFKCRFLGGHVRKAEDSTLTLIQDESKKSTTLRPSTEVNYLDGLTMKLLRTRKVGTVICWFLFHFVLLYECG